jgi:hypothetical protein
MLQFDILMSSRVCYISSGTFMEVHYELLTFGIPTSVLPLDKEGVFNLEYHKKWLDQRNQVEEARRKELALPGSVVHRIPQNSDVLFGRDKMAQQHPGNTRYLNLIESAQDSYDTAPTKASRTMIATEIVVAIKSRGGLFLKHADGIVGWIEAGDVTAKEKVTNAFRSRRRKAAATKQAVVESATSASMQDKRQSTTSTSGCEPAMVDDKDDSFNEAADVDGTENRECRKRASTGGRRY